jgi:hypothetical protein
MNKNGKKRNDGSKLVYDKMYYFTDDIKTFLRNELMLNLSVWDTSRKDMVSKILLKDIITYKEKEIVTNLINKNVRWFFMMPLNVKKTKRDFTK